MNEYNERFLKNALEDLREEQDAVLLKEFEEAKNDPRFQVKEGEAEAFAKKYLNKKKKSTQKFILKVAAVFIVLTVSFTTLVPIPVQGQKQTVVEILMNFSNPEHISIGKNPLIAFEGQYIPSIIPNGYEVDEVSNSYSTNEITLINSNGKKIIYTEFPENTGMSIDRENAQTVREIEILGFKGIYIEKNPVQQIVVPTNNSIIYIFCNDPEIDLIGFANSIEKK